MKPVVAKKYANTSAISFASITIIAVIALSIVMGTNTFDFTKSSQAFANTSTHVVDLFAQSNEQQPRSELEARFQQAVVMLHAKEYEHAITALHRVIELSPKMPEAYVNMGYALLGLERYTAAQGFFNTAIDLRPYQGNAYWGLAVALENLDDLLGALGAMRTYIHLAPPNDTYVRRARSALWEWDNKLARGPLPEEEKAFLKKGTKQWEDRNSPQRDMPAQDDGIIRVRSIN